MKMGRQRVIVNITLNPNTRKRVDDLRTKTGLTRSAQIEWILNTYLNAADREIANILR